MRRAHESGENHYKWVDAGKFFGCRHIRVNADTKQAEVLKNNRNAPRMVWRGFRNMARSTR